MALNENRQEKRLMNRKRTLARTLALLLALILLCGLLGGCAKTDSNGVSTPSAAVETVSASASPTPEKPTATVTPTATPTPTATATSTPEPLSGAALAADYLARAEALPASEKGSTPLGDLMLSVLKENDFAALTDESFIAALRDVAQSGEGTRQLCALVMLCELDFENSLTEHRVRYCEKSDLRNLNEARLDAVYSNSGDLADAYLASADLTDETFWQLVCQLTPVRETHLNAGSASMDATVYSEILNPYALLMTALAASDFNRFGEETTRCTAALSDKTEESGDPYDWCWEVGSGVPSLADIRILRAA